MISIHKHPFPAPRFLTMQSCAIDISDQAIKYGELESSVNGYVLGKYGQEGIEEGTIVSGKIEKPDLLISALKRLREREHVTFIRVSLPEEQMYLFSIIIPILPFDQIYDTVLLQLEEHIPIGANEVIIDYSIVKVMGEQMMVQVVATPAAIIDSYLSVFNQAGLIPLSFEIEAQAIARAVCSFDDDFAVMIVDFGETRTGISIAYQGKPYFTSTFALGGKELTELVAKNFEMTFAEAEKMKRSYGVAMQGRENEIFPVILNELSILHDELEKDLTYWHTHNNEDGTPHPKISKIILCGGNANFSGIAEYISGSLKIPVVHANAWRNIIDINKNIPEMSFNESLSYVTVIGLCLADINQM